MLKGVQEAISQVIGQERAKPEDRRTNLWIGAVVLGTVLVIGMLMFLAFR
ncbi:MAG TPA: hypothetical protein VIH17_07485 [Candidatus Acidoferrales bacterium]